MKRRTTGNKCRKFFKKSIIVVNGTILGVLIIPFCVLFALIDIIWIFTDEMVRKLDSF